MQFPMIAVLTIAIMASASATTHAQSDSPGRANARDLGDRLLSAEQERSEIDEELETDRDSFTPATTTVGTGVVLFESAYSFIDNRRVPETHSFPEILTRIGLNHWLELRMGTNYEIGGAGNPVSANIPDDLATEAELEEESNVSYGLKCQLYEGSGWRPQCAVVIQGFTPTSGAVTATHVTATYVAGWTLRNDWVWDSALRYSTGTLDEDQFNVWSPSSVLKVPFGEQWKAHVEYFGIFSDGRASESAQHFFSTGAHYLITPNWELGMRTGWGLNDQSPHFFANAGIGFRF